MTTVERIQEFHDLKDGWDGANSYAPLPETLANVQALLAVTPEGLEEPDLTPTANGTVYLGWERGSNAYLDIEVGKGQVAAILVLENGPQFCNTSAADLEEVIALMRLFLG